MTRLSINRSYVLSCLLVLAGCAEDEQSRPHDTRVEARIQAVLDDAVASQEAFLPGTIAYYRHPDYAPWSGSAGVSDMEAGTPVRPEQRIRAGSIIKTFLATVTLQHVEEGTLSFDQTLTDLLPRSLSDRVQNADRITLHMLLNHQSGIPDWVSPESEAQIASDPAHVWTTDEMLDFVADQEPEFEPGTSLHYSNTNYNLVGEILDRLDQGDWRTQVRERVLDRLALKSTALPEPGDRTFPGEYMHGYQEADGIPIDLSDIDPSMAGAAGGNAMITTVEDLGRFMEALLDGQLFEKAEMLTAMTTMVPAEHESGWPYAYGLGLESFEGPSGTKILGHAGGTAGYATMVYRIVGHDCILATSVNTGDLFTNALSVFMPAADAIRGESE